MDIDKAIEHMKSFFDMDIQYKMYLYDKAMESKINDEFLFRLRQSLYNGSFSKEEACKDLRRLGCDVMDFQQFKRNYNLDNLLNE